MNVIGIHRAHRPIPVSSFRCHNKHHSKGTHHVKDGSHVTQANIRIDPKVLIFVENQYSLLGRQLIEVLEAARIKYKVEISGKNLPVLTNLEKGKFAVVVFENFDRYLYMNKWNRELLDKYCSEYSAGVIGFMPQHSETQSAEESHISHYPFATFFKRKMRKYSLNPDSEVLRIAKAGEIIENLPSKFSVFDHHPSFETVAEAEFELSQFDAVGTESKQNPANISFTVKRPIVVHVSPYHNVCRCSPTLVMCRTLENTMACVVSFLALLSKFGFTK